MTIYARKTSKLQEPLNNIHSQLKLHKISSLVKDIKIKGLQGLVLKLGLDPKDVEIVEKIIKNRNDDTQALRKQFKLSTTEHPRAQEVS